MVLVSNTDCRTVEKKSTPALDFASIRRTDLAFDSAFELRSRGWVGGFLPSRKSSRSMRPLVLPSRVPCALASLAQADPPVHTAVETELGLHVLATTGTMILYPSCKIKRRGTLFLQFLCSLYWKTVPFLDALIRSARVWSQSDTDRNIAVSAVRSAISILLTVARLVALVWSPRHPHAIDCGWWADALILGRCEPVGVRQQR